MSKGKRGREGEGFKNRQIYGKYSAWFDLQGKQLAVLLDEDPALMDRRAACAKRLELYKQARDEIDSVAWTK